MKEDIELEQLTEFIKHTNIPWLLSNVKDKITNQPLAGGQEYHVLIKHNLKVLYSLYLYF